MFLLLRVTEMLMRLPFFFGREQVHRNSSAEPERPPGRPATAARALGHLLASCDVSAKFLTLHGSSLARQFVLYRALVAGLRATDAAVRHLCG